MTDPKRKPRVLFLHQGGELYGSDIVFSQVVAALHDLVEPIVVLDNSGPLIDRLRPYAHEIIVHPLGVLRRKHFNPAGMLRCGTEILRATFWLSRLIYRERIDLVYSNTIGVLPGALAARITRRPHLWHIHEIIVTPKWLARALANFTYLFSTKLVCISAAVATELQRGQLRKRVKHVVVHNSIDASLYPSVPEPGVRVKFTSDPETVLIALVGRIHFWKGQDYFLDVLHLLNSMGYPKFLVLFVGSTYAGYEHLESELKRKAQILGLESRVVFCGYRHDVPQLLSAVDIVVVPSMLPEPFGLVALEAMAAAKPVVAHAHGGLVEMIEDGVTGYLVPVGQPRVMAEKIILLAQNPELRAKMGQRGRQRVLELFSPDRFREKIRKVVLEQLHNSG